VVAANDPRFLQRTDAAEARRGRQPGAGGKVDVRDPPLGLKLGDDNPVDGIELETRTVHGAINATNCCA